MDITESKQMKEALILSEEKYRSILENIQEGYFEVDLAGNFTFFNDSMCRITGYSQKELAGSKAAIATCKVVTYERIDIRQNYFPTRKHPQNLYR